MIYADKNTAYYSTIQNLFPNTWTLNNDLSFAIQFPVLGYVWDNKLLLHDVNKGAAGCFNCTFLTLTYLGFFKCSWACNKFLVEKLIY